MFQKSFTYLRSTRRFSSFTESVTVSLHRVDSSAISENHTVDCDVSSRNCGDEFVTCSDNSGLDSVDVDLMVKPKPKPRLDESALFKLKKERNPDKLFQFFMENARKGVVVADTHAFEDTVSTFAKARRFDYIENLLEHQKSLPQGTREGFVVRIIMLYGRAGMVTQAVDTFYNMHLFGCKRTVKSLGATMKVLADAGDLVGISSLIKEAPCKFGIEFDVITMNIVVSALCRMKVLDKAYLVMVEMEKQGIKPDVVTFTTLISGFYKSGQCEIGNGLWNLMVCKGCYPNVATFNARIQFLISRRRVWAANDLLRLMEELDMPPDEISYTLVIKGFFGAGSIDMAKRVYSAMHGRGCKADFKIYQTMIHHLCKAKQFNSAYNMCKECLKKNWSLDVGTICILLEGLKSVGKVHNAWMIIGLAERKHPPFPTKQLDTFKFLLRG